MATPSNQAGGTGERGAGKTGGAARTSSSSSKPDGRKSKAGGAAQSGGGTKRAGATARSGGSAKAGAASGAAETGAAKRAPRRTKKPDGQSGGDTALRKDLREFVQAHPGGWGHNEWIGLVNLLKDRGHDTSDTDAVGMALERERLTLVLERVPGLGPQRVNAIADRYPRIWNLMQAGAEEIAMAANLPKAVAKRVKDALP